MRNWILSLLTIIILIGTAPFCFSDENDPGKVRFHDLIATTSETHLILFGFVNNSFTREMISGLKSGVPVDFSFYIELLKKSETSYGELVSTLEFRHTMSYDTLKDLYKVELGEDNRIILFTSLEEAQKTMSEVNGVKVIRLARLVPDTSYQLKIRADLFKKTLPMSLHRILPFVTWWDKETNWHTIEFKY